MLQKECLFFLKPVWFGEIIAGNSGSKLRLLTILASNFTSAHNREIGR